MTELSFELLTGLIEILFLVVGTTIVSTLGVYLELLAFGAVTGGELVFGLWLGVVGGVAVYFGVYLLGFTELLPRVQRFIAAEAE